MDDQSRCFVGIEQRELGCVWIKTFGRRRKSDTPRVCRTELLLLLFRGPVRAHGERTGKADRRGAGGFGGQTRSWGREKNPAHTAYVCDNSSAEGRTGERAAGRRRRLLDDRPAIGLSSAARRR